LNLQVTSLRFRPTILMIFCLLFIIYNFPAFNLKQSLQSFVTSHTCNLNLNVLFSFFNCFLHSLFGLRKICNCSSFLTLQPT
jgi:hypothetical protein